MATLHDIDKAVHKDDIIWRRTQSFELLQKAYDVIQALSIQYKDCASYTYLFDAAESYEQLPKEEFFQFCYEFEYTPDEIEIAINEDIGDEYSEWIYRNQK